MPEFSSTHSPRHLAQQGLSLLLGLAQAPGGHSWRWQCVSPDCRAQAGLGHRGTAPPAQLCACLSLKHLGWQRASPRSQHTHHTPAQDALHLPKGWHRGVPALIVEVPAAPKAARTGSVCLHAIGQLRDTLLRGCGEGTGRLHAHRVWEERWTRGKQGVHTWALLAAVGGADAHRVGTGEAWALHLLTVHFTRGALWGACTGLRGALELPCFETPKTHLAGADGTFDEAERRYDRVPAGARASPRLVPIKVAA